jgi:hypothetical protein
MDFFIFFYFKLQNYELNQSNFVEMPSVRIQEIEIRWMARGNQQSIQHLERLEYQQKKKKRSWDHYNYKTYIPRKKGIR